MEFFIKQKILFIKQKIQAHLIWAILAVSVVVLGCVAMPNASSYAIVPYLILAVQFCAGLIGGYNTYEAYKWYRRLLKEKP